MAYRSNVLSNGRVVKEGHQVVFEPKHAVELCFFNNVLARVVSQALVKRNGSSADQIEGEIRNHPLAATLYPDA